MATEDQHAEAAVARLTELLATAYEPDDVPKPRPPDYVEVTVVRIPGGNDRDGGPGLRRYRLTTLEVGDTVGNARLQRQAAAGLERTALLVDGETTTPLIWETADEIEAVGAAHDSYYAGRTYWLYAH